MKTSVLIIAHNEQRHIGQCIESVLNQTQKPDEVVVIVHNSSDTTAAIAATYPVIVIPFTGERGPVYARIEGLNHVTGDIVLCIDGDTHAKKNWVAVMSVLLQQDNNVLVGSFIHFDGSLFESISNLWNKYYCVSKNARATRWIWGASMAFWEKDKHAVQDIFEQSISLSQKLGLTRTPDDYWLALFMSKRGNLAVTNKTSVTAYSKDGTFISSAARNKENHRNGTLMRDYFNTLQ